MGKNTTTVSGQASDLVVEGLAEAMTSPKAAKAERLAELQRTAKRAAKDAEKLQAWKERTAARNPQVLVDTVRDVPVGEVLDNGLVSKGRVVDIECEVCGEIRTVNVQDAFQVRFCLEHKNEGRKAAGKARRQAAKVAELEQLDESDLDAQIAALEKAA